MKSLFNGYTAALMGYWYPRARSRNVLSVPQGEQQGKQVRFAAEGNGDLMETLSVAIEEYGGTFFRRSQVEEILTNNRAQ